MICPRCEKPSALFVQKITMDKRDTKRNVLVEGKEVFLCDPCKRDWISTSSLFRVYWKKVRTKKLGDLEFEFMYSMFLKENERYGRSNKRKFAQAAVATIGVNSMADIPKRASVFIPDADILTREDYAWAAGVIDAVNAAVTSSGDPKKTCLSINLNKKDILDRMVDLVGGKVVKSGESWLFTTTRDNSESLLRRMDPYLKCSRKNHPTSLSDDDRTLGWLAGFIQASAGDGIKTRCEWASKVLATFFDGEMSFDRGVWTFYPEEGMWEKLKIFIHRKIDPAGAQGPRAGLIPREAGRLPDPVGVGIALGIPKGSHRERPHGPKPNSEVGSNPTVEGGQIVVPKLEFPPPSSVWDSAPTIEIGEKTFSRLKEKSCFLCKRIAKDLEKDMMILKMSSETTLLGKIRHLYAELEIEPKQDCEQCGQEVALRHFEEDFKLCENCSRNEKVVFEVQEDKKWTMV
jgi:hypothetical protein